MANVGHKPPNVVTADWLGSRDRDGCFRDEITAFRRMYPVGLPLTSEDVRQACESGVKVRWLASMILTGAEANEFETARSEAVRQYNADRSQAWAAHTQEQARDEAAKSYDQIRSDMWVVKKKLKPSTESERKRYLRVTAAAEAKYVRVLTDALVAILASQPHSREDHTFTGSA